MGNNANKTKSMGNKLLILIPDKMLAWKPEYSLNEVLMGESHGWWLVWLVVDLWLESAHGFEISHVPSPTFSGISTSHHLGGFLAFPSVLCGSRIWGKAQNYGWARYQRVRMAGAGTRTIEVEEELPVGMEQWKRSSGIQAGWLFGSRYSTLFLGTPGCLGVTEAAVLKGCASGEEVSEGKWLMNIQLIGKDPRVGFI